MATNIVCSDTYIAAFSKLDKKTQKKSLETIRLMQRSLRSDSLKVEKLNTNLNFKSARVTQDFRVIFTQSGNTLLLVYIDHHDDAYLWAGKRIQGFDTESAKPVYEYFEQAKAEDFDMQEDEAVHFANLQKTENLSKNRKSDSKSQTLPDVSGKPLQKQSMPKTTANYSTSTNKNSLYQLLKKVLYASLFLLLGIIIGVFLTGIYT